MCDHNDNTHGEVIDGYQHVICEDCGARFNMGRPELGWHHE